MTEHAEIVPLQDTITTPITGSLQRLEAEAAAMETAFKLAKGLSKTQMVPEHFQQDARDRGGHPNGEKAAWNLAAAILYGAELGMSASASAQNVFIVKGRPAVYARTMAAQVRAAGFKLQEVEATDEKVVWRAERDGHWAYSEWTIDRAKQAGYTSNSKYQSNPLEMLRAKCIAEVCRIQFQDVLLGMAYTVEELQLEDKVTVQRVVARDKENRGAAALRELAAQATQQESAAAEIVTEAGAEQPGQPTITPEQVDVILAAYKKKGLKGAEILDDITQFLQLEGKLGSVHTLLRDDADALITMLQTPAA